MLLKCLLQVGAGVFKEQLYDCVTVILSYQVRRLNIIVLRRHCFQLTACNFYHSYTPQKCPSDILQTVEETFIWSLPFLMIRQSSKICIKSCSNVSLLPLRILMVAWQRTRTHGPSMPWRYVQSTSVCICLQHGKVPANTVSGVWSCNDIATPRPGHRSPFITCEIN